MLLAVRQCHGIDDRCLSSSMVDLEERRLRRCNDEAGKGREESSGSNGEERTTLLEREMGWTGSRLGSDAGRAAVPPCCGGLGRYERPNA